MNITSFLDDADQMARQARPCKRDDGGAARAALVI
jgi:hypothetical protein